MASKVGQGIQQWGKKAGRFFPGQADEHGPIQQNVELFTGRFRGHHAGMAGGKILGIGKRGNILNAQRIIGTPFERANGGGDNVIHADRTPLTLETPEATVRVGRGGVNEETCHFSFRNDKETLSQ